MDKNHVKQVLLHKTSTYIDDVIEMHNALTGEDTNMLYQQIRRSIKSATQIDIVVSFLMESGVRMIVKDLKEAVSRGVKIRLLTGDYLNITQPSALYLIKQELGEHVDLRLYNVRHKVFHPKAYIFHSVANSEIYIGSSNLSRGALTTSVEWNYRFDRMTHEADFLHFSKTFEQLFLEQATPVDQKVLEAYTKRWRRPALFNMLEDEERQVVELYEPRGAQIEALYALDQARQNGWDRGLVIAATGIGKTYLSAFDARGFKRVLFIAHREEIIKQAAQTFRQVRQTDDIGYFYHTIKQKDAEVVCALVQTLGKTTYLQEDHFKKDAFDYIIVDECHHAVAPYYQRICDYFEPQFWLFLTATPERMDNADVFQVAHWNTVYEVRLKEAIDKGWLVPFRYYGIYDDTIDYCRVKIRQGQYCEKELEEHLMIATRAQLVLKHYLKYVGKRALGFCSSRAHAEYMAAYFTSEGIRAVAVYSGTKGPMHCERSRAIDDLRDGKIAIIFSVDMFNEGVDIPEIDMVLFLRPTESMTVFLQQLGRGLRKAKGKQYLNVLDFIGNYKRAQYIPFFINGQQYTPQSAYQMNPQQMVMPEGCLVDFDFRLIDLFKEMAQQEMRQKDLIKIVYQEIEEWYGKRPTRVELMTALEEDMYIPFKKHVFSDYLTFLSNQGKLLEDEERLMGTIAEAFIQFLETTNMSRTYKMPLLLTFYNEGNIRFKITEQEAVDAFKRFYKVGSNSIDLMRSESTRSYLEWKDNKWLKLIKNNPCKFLLRTSSNWFGEEEGYLLTLDRRLEKYSENPYFKRHMKDAIDLRLAMYYRDRFKKDK